jgi:protocatechuate 3,4-dioxygenase beta subunit
MSKTITSAALLVAALLLSAGTVRACSCMESLSPCAAYRGTPVVFAGLVKSIEEKKVELMRFGKKETVRVGLTAHFLVEEPLKDISAAEVDVVTGGGGGDCGYDFKAGERYLVYAYKSESDALDESVARTVIAPSQRTAAPRGVLGATICSRTRPLAQAQDDLELLRALIKGHPQTRIFGVVSKFVRPPGTYEYDIKHLGPMAGLTVKAEGAQGKFETRTDDEGRYRFTGLAPGKYKVGVQLPEGYGPLFDFHGMAVELEVTATACGVEHDFDAQIDGRIGGHMFDADGRPVGDQVQVSVVTLASAGKNFALAESRSDYTKGGRYEIEGLPPGRYVLGVSIADPPENHTAYPTTYFPAGSDLTQATIIELAEGQKLSGYDIHLPRPLELVTITGVVLRADGKPAAGAKLNIYDAGDPGYALAFGTDVKSDAQGRFSIKGFKGRRYLLHAYLEEDYFAGTGVQSEAVEIDTGGQVPPVKLVLNTPGIFRSAEAND